MLVRSFLRVEVFRHASQKCLHFFEGMQAAACTRLRSHTCGLSCVFSDVHAAGKNDFTSFHRLLTVELCEALTPKIAEITKQPPNPLSNQVPDRVWRETFARCSRHYYRACLLPGARRRTAHNLHAPFPILARDTQNIFSAIFAETEKLPLTDRFPCAILIHVVSLS